MENLVPIQLITLLWLAEGAVELIKALAAVLVVY
jgi:hypothetical protein